MTAAAVAAVWDYAILEHKVSFDPLRKIMRVMTDVTEIDVRVDIYSDAKEWLLLNSQYLPPVRSIGGDPTTNGGTAGSIFFLTNGWQLVTDHAVTITGVLFSDNFPEAVVASGTAQLVKQIVSNIVDNANVGEVQATLETVLANIAALPTAAENAAATLLALDSAITTLTWVRRRLEANEVRTPTRLTVTDKDTAEILVEKDVTGSQQTTTITLTEVP